MPEPVRGTTQPARVQTHVQAHVPASAPVSASTSISASGSVPASVPSSVPVSMAASAPVAIPASAGASDPVLRRAPEPAAEDWARYAVTRGRQPPPGDPEQARLAAAAAAAAAASSVGSYGAAGSPQHTISAPANGDHPGGGGGGAVPPEESDASNRNSMGFQITSITQSSAEPDADPIDESGDEDVSDTAESSRTSAGGGGLAATPRDGSVSTVDGLPGRLMLPLAGTPPPSVLLTPRELTASPGVTGSEVLPVIPTIDGFGITLMPGSLEAVDAHGNAEIVEFPSEIEMDLMPTGLTVGVAPGSPGDDLQETWQSRFKVVKIETNVPFKRGRWQCMDYMDQPEAGGGGVAADGPASAASSSHSSVQLTTGEPELPPQLAASEEASLPGLAEDPGIWRDASLRHDAASHEPSAAAAAGALPAQPSVSVPHHQTAAAGAPGLAPCRDAAAACSAPSVHQAAPADRAASLVMGAAPGGLARQSSQPATPEETRLAADGVPVFRPAEDPRQQAGGGLTLPDLLPNSSFLELVQATVTDEQEGAADSSFSGLARALSTGHFTVLGSSPPAESAAAPPTPASTSPGSSGTVEKVEPIDNKIEQAMDLVKSHLLLAVREEVDVLKANISKLVDKIGVLERENEVLKSNATPHVLAQLETAPSLAPSPPPPAPGAAAAAPPAPASAAAPAAPGPATLQPPPPHGVGPAV